MNLSRPFISRPGRHDAADDRHRAGRRVRVHHAAGRAAAAGRFPDHLGAGHAAGREPGDRGDHAWRRRSSGSSGAIADVTEMTSSSSLGSTRITLQFDLNRDIDGAARDVQAAINAARADLPAEPAQQPDVPQGQSRRRADPDPRADLGHADAGPDVRRRLHRAAAEAVAGGRRRRGRRRRQFAARRCASNSNRTALIKYGIGLEDVRAALAAANANSPKGSIEDGDRATVQIYTNDQAQQGAAVPGR